MNRKLDSLKYGAFVLFLLEAVLAIVMEYVFYMRFATIMLIVVVIDAIYVLWMVYSFQREEETRHEEIKNLVENHIDEAISFGDVGMVEFDQDYKVKWMSDLFQKRNIDFEGEKLTTWIPELSQVFGDEVDHITVSYLNQQYLVQRASNEPILYFKDVTENQNLKDKISREQQVVGLIRMDNYNSTIQYEDEQKIALINSRIRQRVADWCEEEGMLAKRVQTNRFMVVTDRQHFNKILEDRFPILNEVRNEAQALNVAITLSMSFAMGDVSITELDDMATELMELCQNRGGDQVAYREYGEEVKFVGGTVESSEKRSGVRVRVMAQTIRGMMENADQVFILVHALTDFDCMGGALGASRMAYGIGKNAYIVSKGFPMETKLTSAMQEYESKLTEIHHFITPEVALDEMTDKSLVVVVDHHTKDQAATPEVLEKAKNIMIIDHHRRRKDDNITANLLYLESGASSTTELVTELLQYQPQGIELTEEEANIMFAGIVVDTNHFRNRCGTRTFEAASVLREEGADPHDVDNLLKRTFDEFERHNKLVGYSQMVANQYILAPVLDEEIFTRAQLSEAADFLLSIQDVKASFVIGKIDEETVAISARSAGEVNVQVIMESMHGGGHFTAAALQRKDTTVEDLTKELIYAIEEYVKEGLKEHESNPTD